MTTMGEPSDRDPKTAPDTAGVQAEGGLPRVPLADPSDETVAESAPGSDRSLDGWRDVDALSAFLPESVIRARQTAIQPETPIERRPLPPDSFVRLTDVVRVTSNPTSDSGSSTRAVAIAWLCVALVIIGVAFQFVEVWRKSRQAPANPGAAATSAGTPPSVPPAATPTVEVPRQDVAPTLPPPPKAVEQRARIAPDVPAGVDGPRSRPQPAPGEAAPLTSKAEEKTVGAGDSVPPMSHPALPPPVAAPLTVAELPKVDPPPPPRPSAPPPPVATAAPEVDHREAIQRVLDAYKDSYDRLDAPSAALIWRGVDSRALARAFSGLSSQDLSFDQCDVSIDVPQATAVCRGELRYVRRVGTPTPHVLRASWTIDLERATDRWVIMNVNVR